MDNNYNFIEELTKISVEFQSENNEFHSLKSYVKSVQPDRILIDMPSNDGIAYKLPIGQPINIVISTTSGGLYLCKTEVIEIDPSHISGVWINYPYSVHYIQRREYFRVPLNLKAELIIFNDDNNSIKQEFIVNIRDISGNGFSFTADQPMIQYNDVECKIYIDGAEGKPIVSKCRHIHSNKVEICDKNKYINAFIFLDISQKDVTRLVRAGFKYQIELKKKGFNN
jgi:c-di-GMP-binding flagellar brake protein YcgR